MKKIYLSFLALVFIAGSTIIGCKKDETTPTNSGSTSSTSGSTTSSTSGSTTSTTSGSTTSTTSGSTTSTTSWSTTSTTSGSTTGTTGSGSVTLGTLNFSPTTVIEFAMGANKYTYSGVDAAGGGLQIYLPAKPTTSGSYKIVSYLASAVSLNADEASLVIIEPNTNYQTQWWAHGGGTLNVTVSGAQVSFSFTNVTFDLGATTTTNKTGSGTLTK